ncbi:uncharacterized protein PV09_01909 [Verruconis gallopava]|uniref:Uncharacterized protein n=1 Tax=Verruconis gallopava TaxID=253628 RepID=A0A0D2B726_9PEZI|nr:uncharacterized protein PV09_01909 [Verruconis gallopava]KIW07014.1 hypothetical protein PV09_01909 [Verruconis gallopava]
MAKRAREQTNETSQPFANEAATFTYVPRSSGAPTPSGSEGSAPSNAPPNFQTSDLRPQYRLVPIYEVPWFHSYGSQPCYSHYSQPLPSTLPACWPGSFETKPLCYNCLMQQPIPKYYQVDGCYYYTPSQPPMLAASSYNGRRLRDGTYPWYGRTRDEVQADGWKEREQCERQMGKEAKGAERAHCSGDEEAKAIEPKGKPTDLYWVQHKDGGLRAYPLGTIRINFQGAWKIDSNGWPYLVEK